MTTTLAQSPPSSDLQLLQRFTLSKDEAAFTQLVHRHIDLVTSAARRQLPNSHDADDATQAVFLVLAQKAHKLPASPTLAPWLVKATYFACANIRKQKARRLTHEAKATTMNPNPHSTNADESTWQQIAPHLDAALAALTDHDRALIALKYLQGRSNEDLQQTFTLSEPALKKRITRALTRLRNHLFKRQADISLSALALTLPLKAIQSAPAGTAARVALGALHPLPEGAAAAYIPIAKGVSHMFTLLKLKFALAISLALLATGAVLTITAAAYHLNAPAHSLATDTAPATDTTPSDPDAPTVLSTSPKNQATDIDPNTTELRVTFSLPMRDGSYSFVKESNDDFPKVIGKPTFSPDHKTCTLPVKLEPQHTYIIWINTDQYHSFTSQSGHPATPYQLFFTTK